jgi:hypothetical protein
VQPVWCQESGREWWMVDGVVQVNTRYSRTLYGWKVGNSGTFHLTRREEQLPRCPCGRCAIVKSGAALGAGWGTWRLVFGCVICLASWGGWMSRHGPETVISVSFVNRTAKESQCLPHKAATTDRVLFDDSRERRFVWSQVPQLDSVAYSTVAHVPNAHE